MGYIPVESDHWPWFLALSRDTGWKFIRRKEIHEYEVRLFREAGAKLRGEWMPREMASDA